MALTSKFDINLNITYTGSPDIGSLIQQITESRGCTLTNGTGANKGDICYEATRTLADAASEELDLHDGTLKDRYGNSLTFDIVRQLYIKNNSSDAGLDIGGAAATQVALFGDPASDILTILPGGEFVFTAPNAAGLDVSANAHLKIAHDSTGSSSLTYDIIICGED